MLSPEGRCKALDASADGYVRAEACATLVLGHHHHWENSSGAAAPPAESGQGLHLRREAAPLSYLLGSSVNQDGRSSGLTAPNGPAQQDVLRAALASAGLAPAALTSLELHGTGTPLGDPIEAGAAAAVLAPQQHMSSGRDNGGSQRASLIIAAAKSKMGHSEAGAGQWQLHIYHWVMRILPTTFSVNTTYLISVNATNLISVFRYLHTIQYAPVLECVPPNFGCLQVSWAWLTPCSPSPLGQLSPCPT